MNTQIKLETPTAAEMQKIINQAQRMRSEYMTQSIKTGLSNLRGLFAHKQPAGNATA